MSADNVLSSENGIHLMEEVSHATRSPFYKPGKPGSIIIVGRGHSVRYGAAEDEIET